VNPHNKGRSAEEAVREVLERELRIPLHKCKLTVGKNSNGEEIKKEFDLVSDDEKIVVEVKSYKLGNNTTQKAGYTTTRKWRLIGACFYLGKVEKAAKRILALTDKELFTQFKNDMDGLLNSNIEIRYVPCKAP
jgi:hypothetical protein